MNRSILFSGAAFVGALMPIAAQAQSQGGNPAAEESAFGSDDIIVTARRREESLQSVPVAVTVYGSEALEQRSIRSAADLSGITPAISML